MEPVEPKPVGPEPPAAPAFHRIVVIGHGLIGGSIALAVGERMPGASIITLDRGSDTGAAVGADLIVLAAPVSAILELLPGLARIISATTVLTDTGSTKATIVRAADGLRFVGGHPIAGGAVAGLTAARADLFTGRPWILTPTATSAPDDVARLEGFVAALGAEPHFLDADEHDRLFALLSHLPQLVVSALMDVVGTGVGERALALAGEGLRDTTRLATSPSSMWRDILQTNEAPIHAAMDDLIALLVALRNDQSGEILARTFDNAARWKSALDRARYNR